MKTISCFGVVILSLVFMLGTPQIGLGFEESTIEYTEEFRIVGPLLFGSETSSEIAPINSQQIIARSGCCSWHGGVCDCYAGRVVCCDGTYSPSCRCHHDDRDIGQLTK